MRNFKKDFDAWLLDWSTETGCENPITMRSLYSDFGVLPKSMQWGIHEDFFDSMNIGITVIPCYNNKNILTHYYYDVKNVRWEYLCKTRKQARQQALEKAIEMYES